MRAWILPVILAACVPALDAGTEAQFYIAYSKDNGGDGNYKIYYAQATGEFSVLVGPKVVIDSPTAAFGVLSNKGNRIAYVERDVATGASQLYYCDLDQQASITGGPFKLTNDANYTIQYPTITYDKRFGFTRMSMTGGPVTEEAFVSILHRKKKNVLKKMTPVTSNSVQDTQAFLMGYLKGMYYVRDGSIWFRTVNGNGPKGTEKLVLAGAPPTLVYSDPSITKSVGLLTYIKTDASGSANLFRVLVDASGTILGAEEQITFVSPPAKVVRGTISTGAAQMLWVVDRGDGYQDLYRQWWYGPVSNNHPVEAPRLWLTGGYGDRFGAVYCAEP